MTDTGGARPTRAPTSIDPLPPPRTYPRGYHWTAGLVGVLYVALLILIGFAFFSPPGVDIGRAGGWSFAISFLIITPAAIFLLLMSWAVVAVLRRLGARNWPGILQALPAVLLVAAAVWGVVAWLFAGDDGTG